MYLLTIQERSLYDIDKTNIGHASTLTPSIFFKMADKMLTYNTNTITRGFVGGGNLRSSRRKYIKQVISANVISHSFHIRRQGKWGLASSFPRRTPLVSTLKTMILWSSLSNMETGILGVF